MIRSRTFAAFAAFASVLAAATSTQAQLRVANWNITNYSSGRVADFQTSLYGVFSGRSMSPDVLLAEELQSATGVNNYLSILNTAPGSPGDWAAAPFVDGPDTDDGFFYRTSKIDYLGMTVVAVGGGSPNHPRNIQRYDVRLKGYTGAGATLACYPSHMKSGDASDDQARRLLEAQRIRDNAEVLNSSWQFLLGGDFNIQSSSQAAYVELTGSQVNNAGRLFDPIKTPGSWNNTFSFRFVHTQDPAGAGGMDDRHDQLLLKGTLIDGVGFDYIGNPNVAYSTTTWNDPNHSYRSWGNDGSSFNAPLNVATNAMVGPTIAQALFNAANGQGHLPVFLDLRVPAKVNSETILDFGSVAQFSTAQQTLNVSNSANAALWNAAGIANLNYTLAASAGFTAPGGGFLAAPAAAANAHTISMNTSTLGPVNGTLTINSDSVDEPARVVQLTGTVVPSCDPYDVNCDTAVDGGDVAPFVGLLISGGAPCSSCAGDGSGNGGLDADDIQPFVTRLITGP